MTKKAEEVCAREHLDKIFDFLKIDYNLNEVNVFNSDVKLESILKIK